MKRIKTHSMIPVITKPADARKTLNDSALAMFLEDVAAADLYNRIVTSKFGTKFVTDMRRSIELVWNVKKGLSEKSISRQPFPEYNIKNKLPWKTEMTFMGVFVVSIFGKSFLVLSGCWFQKLPKEAGRQHQKHDRITEICEGQARIDQSDCLKYKGNGTGTEVAANQHDGIGCV